MYKTTDMAGLRATKRQDLKASMDEGK